MVISTGGMIALCLMLQRRHQLAGEDAERAAPGIRRGAQHLQPVHVERPARVRAFAALTAALCHIYMASSSEIPVVGTRCDGRIV